MTTRRTIDVNLTSEEFDTANMRLMTLTGSESLNALFSFDVGIAVEQQAPLDLDTVMGARATLVFVDDGQAVRQVHCVVVHCTDRLASEAVGYWLKLQLSPTAFQMQMVRTQAVFLHQSIPTTIEQKLTLCGVRHEFRLVEQYPVREFVVQYAETDLQFVSRLCEHYGIAFHFEHGERDVMVFSDRNQFNPLPSERRTVPFRASGEQLFVYSLECDRKLIPRHYLVADYNYRTPMVDLTAAARSDHGLGGGVVEYGGHFKTEKEGQLLAQIRCEEQECRRVVYRGTSDRADFGAASRFTLEGHPSLTNNDFVITQIDHHYVRAVHFGEQHEREYSNQFHAIHNDTRFRPARVTPRPRISGVVSGIIEAKPGSDETRPWLDTEGRYRVRVLFDTATSEGKASRAIRMAQAHSGPGYGHHFPLRPGVEVLLSFIDGDVDRPIIIGAVPNAVTPTPVTANDHMYHRIQTTSGIQIEFKDNA